MLQFRHITLCFATAACLVVSAGSHVRWSTDTHNFGTINEEDGTVSCTFTYVNDGDEPLAITAARATCGCTTPTFTRKPVAPGDSGRVEVTYNPAGRPGRFSKRVYIDFNTDPPRSTLTIKGVVIGSAATLRSRYPVEAGVLRLGGDRLMFDEVVTGRAKTQFLDVYNASDKPVRPEWHDLPPCLSVSSLSSTVYPGEKEAFSFTLNADRAGIYGMYTDTIGVTVDGQTPVPVEIVAVITEDFSRLTPGMRASAPKGELSAQSVDFDRYTPGQPLSATVTLTNRGQDALTVRRAYCLDKAVSVSIDNSKLKRGKSATLTIAVDPERCVDGVINARVQLITNDPDNPVTNIRVTGLPEPQP